MRLYITSYSEGVVCCLPARSRTLSICHSSRVHACYRSQAGLFSSSHPYLIVLSATSYSDSILSSSYSDSILSSSYSDSIFSLSYSTNLSVQIHLGLSTGLSYVLPTSRFRVEACAPLRSLLSLVQVCSQACRPACRYLPSPPQISRSKRLQTVLSRAPSSEAVDEVWPIVFRGR
jgi:hypothetical protein